MKIGITISDFYKSFLEEAAKLNGMSPTRICSLIVLNYLSFNKEKGRIPLFYPKVSVVYANKVKKTIETDNQEEPSMTWDQLQEQLKNVEDDPEDSGLPFEYESED